MGKPDKFFWAQWRDIKGNAKWQVIFTGASSMITATIRFLAHAPLWEVIAVFFATALCVSFILWVILSVTKPKAKNEEKPEMIAAEIPKIPAPFQPDDRTKGLFTKMVDMVKADIDQSAGRLGHGPVLDALGALAHCSNEIQSEDELLWCCWEFDKHGYKNPLKDFQDVLTTKWLPVLIEARHNKHTVKNDMGFCDFLVKRWSGQAQWKAANYRKNLGIREPAAPNNEVYPEFIAARSGWILHTCTKCGFNYKIKNPLYTAYGQAGLVTVTCNKCGQRDVIHEEYDLKKVETPDEILDRVARRNFPEHFEKIVTIDTAIWKAAVGEPRVVTDFVKAHIKDGKLEIECTTAIFGDPCDNQPKVLVIDYWYDGKKLQKMFPGGQIARLP